MRGEDGNHFVARAKKSAHAGQNEDVNIEPAGRVLKKSEKQQLSQIFCSLFFVYVRAAAGLLVRSYYDPAHRIPPSMRPFGKRR